VDLLPSAIYEYISWQGCKGGAKHKIKTQLDLSEPGSKPSLPVDTLTAELTQQHQDAAANGDAHEDLTYILHMYAIDWC